MFKYWFPFVRRHINESTTRPRLHFITLLNKIIYTNAVNNRTYETI